MVVKRGKYSHMLDSTPKPQILKENDWRKIGVFSSIWTTGIKGQENKKLIWPMENFELWGSSQMATKLVKKDQNSLSN